ncbi:hypothetical protein ACUXJ9_001514 [Staphylococcus caledonicus]
MEYVKGGSAMSTHENHHYEEFEASNIKKDDLMDIDELKQLVGKFENNNEDEDLKQRINTEIGKWKEYIRDQFRPEDPAEKSRLSNIADKVHGDVNVAFEYNEGDKIYDFLEASYQRSKEDLVYGRTLILYSESEMIKQSLTFFDSKEENHKLVTFINSKNIEIGKEIMSEDYIELLETEHDYLNALFK